MRFTQAIDGEWIRPLDPKNYKITCCDCGLVHRLEFDTDENGDLIFRAWRDNRSTGQRRRFMREGEDE